MIDRAVGIASNLVLTKEDIDINTTQQQQSQEDMLSNLESLLLTP